jgi:hypothetical protein
MSIASISLCPSVNIQNLNVGVGTPSGGIINLLGDANNNWQMGVVPSTTPTTGNSFVIQYPSNDAKVVIAPEGGSATGDGSVAIFSGDIQTEGNIEVLEGTVQLSNLPNAQSLATDANGNIIQGTATSSVDKWQLAGSLFTDNTFGDTTVGGTSYAIIDNDARVVTIFLNLIIIVASNRTNVSPAFSIDVNQNFFTQPNTQPGTLPPPNALFQSYASNLSSFPTIFFFNDVSLCNITTNPYTFANCQYYFSGYFVNSGLMNISSLGTVSATTSQRLIYSGTIQYMF